MEMFIGPNVQLHHTKLLAKPPQKGGGFPLHQDYPYFPHAKHTMLAVSVYLTIHGSGPNTSTRPRRNILIEMRDPEDLPIVDRHVSRSQGMMLRGINPLSLDVAWKGKIEPTL